MSTIRCTKEINKKDLSSYYYEVFLIWSKRNKDKILSSTSYSYPGFLIKFIIYFIYILFFTIFLFFTQFKLIFSIIYVIFLFFLFYFFYFIIRIKNAVKIHEKRKGKRVVTIDKDELTSSLEDLKITLKTNSIKCIVVGDYSLTFIPKSNDSIPISLPIEYKDEIMDALNKEKVKINILSKESNES